jgi:hypothetical protein
MKRFLTVVVALILSISLCLPVGATGYLLGSPKFYAQDVNGNPLVGGKLYSYRPGTSTAKATYSDSGLTTANTNPIVLDARGEASVYLNGATKLVLKDSAGATIWTWANAGTYGTMMLRTVTPEDFGAVGDGTTDDTVAIQAAIDSLTTGGAVLFQKTYKVVEPAALTACLTISHSNTTLYSENKAKIKYGGTASGVPLIKATSLSNVRVQGLELDGNAQMRHFSVWLDKCTNSHVLDNYIHNNYSMAQGIVVMGSDQADPDNFDSYNNIVSGNVCVNHACIHVVTSKDCCVSDNIVDTVDDNCYEVDTCQNIVVSNCVGKNSTAETFLVSHSQVAGFSGPDNITFNNCISRGGMGFSIFNQNGNPFYQINFANCISDGGSAGGTGFAISGINISLSNCSAFMCGATGYGILDYGGANHNISNFNVEMAQWGYTFAFADGNTAVTGLNINGFNASILIYDVFNFYDHVVSGTIQNIIADMVRNFCNDPGSTIAAGLAIKDFQITNMSGALFENTARMANCNISNSLVQLTTGALTEMQFGTAGIKVMSGTTDPSAASGVVAPIGSLYTHTTTGQLYSKTGSGNTQWTANH